jgi:hypothetical protein
MGMTIEFAGLSEMMPDIDEIGVEMAAAAGPVLVEKTKKAVQGVIKHEGDSELARSVTMSKPKKGKWGDFIVSAYFKGNSKTKTYRHTKTHRGKYAVSNALKAVWKEYGIPSRGIPAQPFIDQATKSAEDEALKKMQDVFDQRMNV